MGSPSQLQPRRASGIVSLRVGVLFSHRRETQVQTGDALILIPVLGIGADTGASPITVGIGEY